ncbi:MAG: histidinol dehydrogenase, partial [bacterium]
RGNLAVIEPLERIDESRLRVSEEEFDAAGKQVSDPVLEGIRVGIETIRTFNQQLVSEEEWRVEIAPGIEAGEKSTPVASAGLFVPSGKGSYPSVLVQLGTPATVAGVPEIIVVVPPAPGGDGEVDPAVLCAARELGLKQVFRANGPSGVAALALGTETIPRVRKVVGPGSPPVQAAQILCQVRGCHTQMLCGPSESMIIADSSADPDLLAADLLNEAEHGPDSSSVLVTDSLDLVESVEGHLTRRVARLPEPRQEFARTALGRNGGAIVVSDLAEAAEVANLYAPEHMQLATDDDDSLLKLLDHAGEVLLGQDTPISLANYVLGVPAALPTGSFARVTGGITAETFRKKMSVARASGEALSRFSPAVEALADHEGFPAHLEAIWARQKKPADAD